MSNPTEWTEEEPNPTQWYNPSTTLNLTTEAGVNLCTESLIDLLAQK